jgi:hypothetical protein
MCLLHKKTRSENCTKSSAAISQQSAVLFSRNKSAPATSQNNDECVVRLPRNIIYIAIEVEA